MSSPRVLELSGLLFFLSFLGIIATILGLIQGAQCGAWHCSWIFLGLTLFFFFWGIEVVIGKYYR